MNLMSGQLSCMEAAVSPPPREMMIHVRDSGSFDQDDDEEFYLATGAARRLVSQCRAHAEQTSKKLSDRISKAGQKTPCGIDQARAEAWVYAVSLNHAVKSIETLSNALISHLRGLYVLANHDTFYPLPAMTVTRSIAEVASSLSWMLHPGLVPDARTARSYASLFAMLDKGIASGRPTEAERTRQVKDTLIQKLESTRPKIHVRRRVKDGVAQDGVAQVRVNREHAQTSVQYSQRMREEIPLVGGLYAHMSAATHGGHAAVSASFDTPASYARGIGYVALESTKAWSRAVHTWIGATPAPFWNDLDEQNLVDSIPATQQAELLAAFEKRTAM